MEDLYVSVHSLGGNRHWGKKGSLAGVLPSFTSGVVAVNLSWQEINFKLFNINKSIKDWYNKTLLTNFLL